MNCCLFFEFIFLKLLLYSPDVRENPVVVVVIFSDNKQRPAEVRLLAMKKNQLDRRFGMAAGIASDYNFLEK